MQGLIFVHSSPTARCELPPHVLYVFQTIRRRLGVWWLGVGWFVVFV